MSQPQRVSEMPTWVGFLRPVLEVLVDGRTLRARDLQEAVAAHFGLTAEQREERIASGMLRYRDRISWAASSLATARAVERPRRGDYVITAVGRQLLTECPGAITEQDLRQIPAYRDHIPAARAAAQVATRDQVAAEEPLNPREQIEAGTERLRVEIATQLVERLRSATPAFLEQAVLDVLIAMGYGGVQRAQGRARRLGGTGDGGVDGVIDQDALGLARIYVQAKRYGAGNNVGRPDVQGFVGALHGQQATQGIFITTSSFTRDATAYAHSVNASIVLVDGDRFANLMITYGVGVQVAQTFIVNKVDEDYFE